MRTVKNFNIYNILFLDIETVPQWRYFKDVPEYVQKEWIYKFKFRGDAPTAPDPVKNPNSDQEFIIKKYDKYFSDLWEGSAGLYAEFAKIACISIGYYTGSELRVTTFKSKDELEILESMLTALESFSESFKDLRLAAHYGKGFDFPFMGKRFLINKLPLPKILDTVLIPKWDNINIDTHEIWQFGDFKNGGTLGSIAMSFGIPSPKDDISGADVARVYYDEDDLPRIAKYCEKDVITLFKVFKCFRGEDIDNLKITHI